MRQITKLFIIIFIPIYLIIAFSNQYISLLKEFKKSSSEKKEIIDRHTDLVSSVFDIITIYGNSYFIQDGVSNMDYYQMIEYDYQNNLFHLDAIENTPVTRTEGNITGIGQVPKEGIIKDEINLAIHFNKIFSSLYNKLPDIVWMHYISEHDFVNRYPWSSSKEFRYSSELKKSYAYQHASPKYNPERQPVWTPVYMDYSSKQLIITFATPIYFKDLFMGVVTLDFTNGRLSKMIESPFDGCLIDEADNVIATSHNLKMNRSIVKVTELLNISESLNKKRVELEDGTVHRLGMNYVYTASITSAPWTIYYQVPIMSIIAKSIIAVLPLLLISIFLLLTLSEIDRRKKTEVLLKNTIHELKSYQIKLEDTAKLDFLTSTLNRRGLKEKFNELIENKEGKSEHIAILLTDIDYFKLINDTFGHAAGDKILIQMITKMKKLINNRHDIICRWGGEEFLLILTNKTYEEAMIVGEYIRKEIEQTEFDYDGESLNVTITIGVTQYNYGNTIEECIEKADKALYQGKEEGRNRVIGTF